MLLKDGRLPDDLEGQIADLLRQLRAVPDFAKVELVPHGDSIVLAFVEARNKRQLDHLKELANDTLHGWHVVEQESYNVPKTF